MQITLAEHTAIYEAITAGDVTEAEHRMRAHIEVGWQRRRFTEPRRASSDPARPDVTHRPTVQRDAAPGPPVPTRTCTSGTPAG